jgi:hypothetical protein
MKDAVTFADTQRLLASPKLSENRTLFRGA